MYPQLGARSFANGSAHLPPLHIREITGAELRLSRSMNPQIRRPVQPVPEIIIPEVIIPEVIIPEVIVPEIIIPDIIIISDDEENNNEDEEDNKDVVAEIDLELKL
ncbi:hypothetical protein MIMGU_mgv1a016820mg [Erythranthe guttata]|uniref:Uncharacterized protein n=1 Tax=Erythranthe guttata TaxID=4155 RepID=A0A022QV45_ERYGU|nr:hypothetical protein MIMGU_mgv1a016820mg [Erythranthe guttata]